MKAENKNQNNIQERNCRRSEYKKKINAQKELTSTVEKALPILMGSGEFKWRQALMSVLDC